MTRSSLSLFIVAFGMAILGLMSLLIVGAAVYGEIAYGKAPEVLTNWGGLIIGFFIGAFFNFSKSALGVEDSKSTS